MKFPSLCHVRSEKTGNSENSRKEGAELRGADSLNGQEPTGHSPQVQTNVKKGLYVYCILPSETSREYGKIGVKNDSLVCSVTFKDIAAAVSEFEGYSFEKTDADILAHQRVVQRIFGERVGVPIKFGTILENEEQVRQFLEEGYLGFKKQLTELTAKVGEISAIDSASPTDVIAEILSQSAASAVRIRQLADSLEAIKRQEYEKGASKLPEGTARELLDFLAKAPLGAYQVLNEPSASTLQTQTLERRIDSLFEMINHLKDMMATQVDSKNVSQFQREQTEIKEAVLSLRAVQNDNKVSLEETVTQAIKEQMSKFSPAKQVIVGTAGNEETNAQPLVFGASSSAAISQTVQTYARCLSCGAGLVITDRFCPHCGIPSYQGCT